MRTLRYILLVGAAILILLVVAVLAADPLRRSDDDVRAWLIATTPIGSQIDDVRSLLDDRGWHDEAYQQRLPRYATPPFLGGKLGGYQGLPWYVTVLAFWEFDDRGRLTGIRICRIMDAP